MPNNKQFIKWDSHNNICNKYNIWTQPGTIYLYWDTSPHNNINNKNVSPFSHTHHNDPLQIYSDKNKLTFKALMRKTMKFLKFNS